MKYLLLTLLLSSCARTEYSVQEETNCQAISNSIYYGQSEVDLPAYCYKYNVRPIPEKFNK